MKKFIYLLVVAMTILTTSCTKFMEEENGFETKTPHTAAQVASVGARLASDMEVLSDELSFVTISNLNTRETADQCYIRRYPELIDLGSKETSEIGSWTVVSSQVGEPQRTGVRAEGLFTITTYRVTVTSIISNGEVEFETLYGLVWEDWSWSNGDTTIVGNVHWDVVNEVVNVNNGSKVQDQLNLNFHEYKQAVSETGNLILPYTPKEIKVPFTVTVDPDNVNTWLVSCAVPVNDGTMVIILSPEGTPITSHFWEYDVNESYNGAYYIKKQCKWYPCIASNQRDGMEWCTGEGIRINLLSYTSADAYSNWGNGNSCEYGGHSVYLTGYSVVMNEESHELVFSFNGMETGKVQY